MKRTTVLLPDDLAYLLDRERRRRGVSAAAIVREAVAAHFNVSSEPRQIPFAALGHSGLPDLGANDEYYLAQGWGSAEFYEQTMGRPRDPADRGDQSGNDQSAARVSGLAVSAVVSAGTTVEAADVVDQSS